MLNRGVDFTSSISVNSLLIIYVKLPSKREYELRLLQSTSYEEVGSAYEKNKVRFSHLPAK